MLVTLLTSHLLKSPLNELQLLNIDSMLVTLLTSHLLKSPLNKSQPLNILSKSVTSLKFGLSVAVINPRCKQELNFPLRIFTLPH